MKEINNEPSLASHEKKAKNIFLVSLSLSPCSEMKKASRGKSDGDEQAFVVVNK
jgi:hypothetical protein